MVDQWWPSATLSAACKVLFVDTQTTTEYTILRRMLKNKAKMEVELAHSAEEAQQLIAKKGFDALVINADLSDSERLFSVGTPCVLLSTVKDDKREVKALKNGVYRYINVEGRDQAEYMELVDAVQKAAYMKKIHFEHLEAETLSYREKLRAILASSPDPIFITDLTGKIIDCNEAVATVFSFSKEEMIGKNGLFFLDDENKKIAIGGIRALIAKGESRNLILRAQNKKGQEIFLDFSANTIKDENGKPNSIVSVVRDITERKKAEDYIRLLSSVAEQAAEGIAVSNIEGKIIFANIAWRNMHDIESQIDVIGENINDFYCNEKESQCNLKIEQIYRGRNSQRRRDGTTFQDLATISPLRSEKGEIIGEIHIIKKLSEIAKEIRDASPNVTIGNKAET
jgi:PAS domain S-box-containing protein